VSHAQRKSIVAIEGRRDPPGRLAEAHSAPYSPLQIRVNAVSEIRKEIRRESGMSLVAQLKGDKEFAENWNCL